MAMRGKVAIVTGASSGIGRATATRLSIEGARLVLVARRAQPLEDVRKCIEDNGGECIVCVGSVRDAETSLRMVHKALETWKRVDIAVLNAGVFETAMLEDVSEEQVDHVFATNFKSVLFGLQALIPAMRESAPKSGSVVVVSSTMGLLPRAPFKGCGVHSASKAAVDMIVKYAAIEAAGDVRINAVAPGVIDTGMIGSFTDDERRRYITDAMLAERAGTPDEVAEVIMFLASDRSRFVTGSTYPVDGGWLLKA